MTPDLDLIAESTRRQILALIASDRELCVCELVAALEDSQPGVSRHLALLREGGWLATRREGRMRLLPDQQTAALGVTRRRRAAHRRRAARVAAHGEGAARGLHRAPGTTWQASGVSPRGRPEGESAPKRVSAEGSQ